MHKFIGVSIAVIALTASLSTKTHAQSVVSWGTITSYNTGWLADSIRVTTTAPTTNPQNCPTLDGYVTSPSDPGNRASQAALLTAFVSGKSVSLVISGCYQGRPQIIGVSIVP